MHRHIKRLENTLFLAETGQTYNTEHGDQLYLRCGVMIIALRMDIYHIPGTEIISLAWSVMIIALTMEIIISQAWSAMIIGLRMDIYHISGTDIISLAWSAMVIGLRMERYHLRHGLPKL